ncbi:hypothetical protein V493_01806, partial [Pseudogymnoascus sp. VKM F-4281 (FW-2241)]
MALWLHSNWGSTLVRTRNYQGIARRELSVNKWNEVGNPHENLILTSRESHIDERDPRAGVWLDNSDKWNKPFPAGWEAVQVLGSGGFGIAGHWTYVHNGPHRPGSVESQVNDIVVKQASSLYANGLIGEATLMEILTRTGSRHFPQIYGRVHRDVGRQERVVIDQKRREVHRIFMEYFSGGCVGTHIRELSYSGDHMPELAMWSFFHCFAKAMVVLAQGHEEEEPMRFLQKDPWISEHEIVHFDMKPDNALIAEREENGEHSKVARVVVSDFGISKSLPSERRGPHPDHDRILNRFENTGTVNFRAPEQQRKLPRNRRRYAACTNVYQVGCMMYCMIMHVESVPWKEPHRITPLTGLNKPFETVGGRLELATDVSFYLRGLIAECLFVDPAHRPPPVDLLRLTRDGLRHVIPWAAMASKLNGRLRPVNSLLLDQWFGTVPGVLWPARIPEMQKIVDLRRKQQRQVEKAKKYKPNPPGGGNHGPKPPPPGGPRPPPPGGPDGGHKPHANNNQPGAHPGAGHKGPGGARGHRGRSEPLPRKSWPGKKFERPIDGIKQPRPKQSLPPQAPAKEPDWNRVAKDLKGLPRGHIPRPKPQPPRPAKRPSPEPAPAPEPKRARRGLFAPLRQMNMVSHWLHAMDLNRADPQQAVPLFVGQKFLLPVRIWPGPSPSPAEEALAELRNFLVPNGANLGDLLKIMKNDPTSGIASAVRCNFAKPGRATELSLSTRVAELGYGPAARVRTAHLECYRTTNVPVEYGPGGVARTFQLVLFITPGGLGTNTTTSLTLQAGLQMTVSGLKKV